MSASSNLFPNANFTLTFQFFASANGTTFRQKSLQTNPDPLELPELATRTGFPTGPKSVKLGKQTLPGTGTGPGDRQPQHRITERWTRDAE